MLPPCYNTGVNTEYTEFKAVQKVNYEEIEHQN